MGMLREREIDFPITFRAISWEDIQRIHRWFNLPHVQAFYSLRAWSEAEVVDKLKPILNKEKPLFGFIIYHAKKPIGYIQYYRLEEYPWPNQNLTKEISASAAGLDLFIADSQSMGKGMGSTVVSAFLKQMIWPAFSYCFVDPDERNTASIRMFQKCGFQLHQYIYTEDALKRPVTLALMKIERPRDTVQKTD